MRFFFILNQTKGFEESKLQPGGLLLAASYMAATSELSPINTPYEMPGKAIPSRANVITEADIL